MKFSYPLKLNMLVLMFIAALMSTGVRADEDEMGAVKGHINFCGKGGIAGMRIYVPGRQYSIITGDDGSFVFDRIPAGEYEFNYMLHNNVIKYKSVVYVFKKQDNDIGEIAFCDDPNFSPADTAASDSKPQTPAASPAAADVSTSGGCTEGNMVKLPNGVGECKEGKIIVKSCDKKWSNCDGQVENGCETDIWTDNRNCGKCGNWCIGDQICGHAQCL